MRGGPLLFNFLGSSLHFESALESFLLLLFFHAEFLFVVATILVYSGAGRFGSFNLFDQALLGLVDHQYGVSDSMDMS